MFPKTRCKSYLDMHQLSPSCNLLSGNLSLTVILSCFQSYWVRFEILLFVTMRSLAIPKHIKRHNQSKEILEQRFATIRRDVDRLQSAEPDVSIIIPAYNEERNILKTLSSLSASSTTKRIQIIVVDNNSTDATLQLSRSTGVTCIIEKQQGITQARNAGLAYATGRYILNADADTIYPPDWIDLMVAPLALDENVMVYGKFSFIPAQGGRHLLYLGYEYMSDLSKWMNKIFREEAVNVYGSNSAFRKSEGEKVGGFNHPPGTNEDGWLGVKLRDTFKKHLFQVKDERAIVWTMDRRLQIDGGLWKGSLKRIRRHINLLLDNK